MKIEQAMSCAGRTVAICADGSIWLHHGDGLVRLVPMQPVAVPNLAGASKEEIYLEHAAQCEQWALLARSPHTAEQFLMAAASWQKLADTQFGLAVIASTDLGAVKHAAA